MMRMSGVQLTGFAALKEARLSAEAQASVKNRR
jgi:hypothetical protein